MIRTDISFKSGGNAVHCPILDVYFQSHSGLTKVPLMLTPQMALFELGLSNWHPKFHPIIAHIYRLLLASLLPYSGNRLMRPLCIVLLIS